MRYIFNRYVYFSLVILLLTSFFFHNSVAKTYAVACGSPYIWGSNNMNDYCNASYSFTDIGSQPAGTQDAIRKLGKIGIFYGYNDCGVAAPCFRPNNSITRWEAAAAIVRYHIFISRDWFSWDPANAPPDQLTQPPSTTYTNDGKPSVFADTYPNDPGFYEAHTAILYGLIRGGSCSDYYTATGTYDTDGMPFYFDNYHNKNLRGDDLCFGAYSPWVFGFHGVYRRASTYLEYSMPGAGTPYPGANVPVTYDENNEECWTGCYDFANGNPSNTMTRAAFAVLMYSYYGVHDDNNWCVSPQTGSISGTAAISGTQALIPDPTNPSNLICTIHADQNSCSTSIDYSTQHTMNHYCNYAYVTRTFQNTPGYSLTPQRSAVIQSDVSTGPSDVISYTLGYLFQINQFYYSTGQFNIPLTTLNFYGKRTSGTISFPGGGCTIGSSASSCSQSISWSTSLVTQANTLTMKDTTNPGSPVSIPINALSGTTNYSISGPTTITLYENNVELTSQTVTPNKQYTISGYINVDYNDNAAIDAPQDGPFTEGTTVTLSTGATTTSNASGYYQFDNIPNNTSYTVSVPATVAAGGTYPDGLHVSSVQLPAMPAPAPVNDGNGYANISLTPYYSVSGGVFVDTNKNGVKDSGESYYTGSGITITNNGGGTVSYPGSGTFTVSRLSYGSNTITYSSSLPNGYVVTIPSVGSGSPAYTVQVGKTCVTPAVSPAGGDGTCTAAGNITNLNFGISNSTPWIQGIGFDMRFDNGIDNKIPTVTNSCGKDQYTMLPIDTADATTQGGVFIGNSAASTSFGVRQSPSSKGWVMDSLYPETFQPVVPGTIRTSYSYILSSAKRSGITPKELSTIATCTDPSVSCSLPALTSGVYNNEGDVILSALSIPANTNVILLIKGNLSITDTITVPTSSTLVVSVGDNVGGTGGNISVASSIGDTPACVLPSGQLQGIFTADDTMTINGTNDCTIAKDKTLTIEGAVVVNASLSTGSFNYYRDLCDDNVDFPAVTIKARPDFVLHASDLIKQSTDIFREVAP